MPAAAAAGLAAPSSFANAIGWLRFDTRGRSPARAACKSRLQESPARAARRELPARAARTGCAYELHVRTAGTRLSVRPARTISSERRTRQNGTLRVPSLPYSPFAEVDPSGDPVDAGPVPGAACRPKFVPSHPGDVGSFRRFCASCAELSRSLVVLEIPLGLSAGSRHAAHPCAWRLRRTGTSGSAGPVKVSMDPQRAGEP